MSRTVALTLLIVIGVSVLLVVIGGVAALVDTGSEDNPPPATEATGPTTTRPLAPAPDDDLVATATTITVGSNSHSSGAVELERLLTTWANQLDDPNTGVRADLAGWCAMADLTADELALGMVATVGTEMIDYVRNVDGLDAQGQARAMDAMAGILGDRLDKYC